MSPTYTHIFLAYNINFKIEENIKNDSLAIKIKDIKWKKHCFSVDWAEISGIITRK